MITRLPGSSPCRLVGAAATAAVLTGALFWTTSVGGAAEPPGAPVQAPAATPAVQEPTEPSAAEWRRRLLELEDARDTSDAALTRFQDALKSKETETRRIAVRALGRMERPTLSAMVAQALADPAPVVRAEAANALAQTVSAGGDLALAVDLLALQLERESQPTARGAMAQALGRLPYKDVDQIRRAERLIVTVLKDPEDTDRARREKGVPAERRQYAPPQTLLGALAGLETLVRLNAKTTSPESATVDLLKELAVVWRSAVARSEGGPSAEAAARMRRLAMAALLAGKAADATTISTAFGDADDQVRRLAAHAATAAEPIETKLVDRAIRDLSGMVRTAVLLGLDARKHPSTCGYASLTLRDPDPNVSLTAIDVAGRACAGNAAATAAVASLAAQPPVPPLQDVDPTRAPSATTRVAPFGLDFRGNRRATWHTSAHALVALARLSPTQAVERLPKFIADDRWHVRMYAARAAGIAKAESVLRTLADDKHANVVEAALVGLRETVASGADDLYIRALTQKDYQLLLTAALSLKGTTRRDEASAALITALDRVTTEKRETSRDPRKAILDRLEEVGSPTLVPRLQPYLRDFDPAIATAAATLMTKWGTPAKATPQVLPRLALPTNTELETMAATRIAIQIRDAGRFEIRLLPVEAPLNAWRFYRQAKANYFDGLTLHRVVPNFVLQGGSPGANEYMGDGPYLRDEPGLLSHQRGTLGISTRGRDTADGQIFINIVDNDRLDHNYTVFAQIEKGIEVIDAVLEGDVIVDIDVTGKDRER